jgi:hypothetical protein
MLKFVAQKTGNADHDAIVAAALELIEKKHAGTYAAADAAKNADLLKAIGAELVKGDEFATNEFQNKGLLAFNNPNVYNAQSVHRNFNVIISEVTSPIIPSVVNDTYQRFLAEVHNGGWGDTGRFIIKSNELFKVNQKAEGVRAGVAQPIFNNEFTLNARDYEISTEVGWYEIATGVFDISDFALRIARSFEAHIFLKVIKAMISASTQFGAAYNTNGVTPTLWGTLAQRVSAANGGMSVVAVGTRVALSNVSLQGNFQVQIGEEMNKVGYLDQYLGIPLIAIENVIVPGTTNTTATLAISDSLIYFIPMGGQRPVKIFMEGNQISIEEDFNATADRSYHFYVDMRYEVSAIVGLKYGTITLA